MRHKLTRCMLSGGLGLSGCPHRYYISLSLSYIIVIIYRAGRHLCPWRQPGSSASGRTARRARGRRRSPPSPQGCPRSARARRRPRAPAQTLPPGPWTARAGLPPRVHRRRRRRRCRRRRRRRQAGTWRDWATEAARHCCAAPLRPAAAAHQGHRPPARRQRALTRPPRRQPSSRQAAARRGACPRLRRQGVAAGEHRVATMGSGHRAPANPPQRGRCFRRSRRSHGRRCSRRAFERQQPSGQSQQCPEGVACWYTLPQRFGAHTEHLARSSAATAAAPDQLASARTCSGCARLLAPRARPARMGRAQRPALRRAHAARRCQRQRQCTAQPRAYQATRCSLTRPAALGKPPAETQADRSYPPMTQHRSSRRALPSPERATVGAAGPAGAPAAARHPVPAALASCMSTHARRTGRGMQADSLPKAALRADARWRRRGGATHVPPAQLFKVRGTRRRRGQRGCLETAPGQLPRRPAEPGLPARPFLARSPRMSWPAGRRCGSSVQPQRLHVAHRLRTAPSHAARRQ